jgi:hypothetical protein
MLIKIPQSNEHCNWVVGGHGLNLSQNSYSETSSSCSSSVAPGKWQDSTLIKPNYFLPSWVTTAFSREPCLTSKCFPTIQHKSNRLYSCEILRFYGDSSNCGLLAYNTVTRPVLVCGSATIKTATCQSTIKSSSIALCNEVRWRLHFRGYGDADSLV